MSSDLIRAKVSAFLSGQIDLPTFHDQIALMLWDIEDTKDPAAQNLLYSVELTILEYTAGHRTEHEFHSQLTSLVAYEHKNEAIVNMEL